MTPTTPRRFRALLAVLLVPLGCSGSSASLGGGGAGAADGGEGGAVDEAGSGLTEGGGADAGSGPGVDGSPESATSADGCTTPAASSVVCDLTNTACADIVVAGDVPTANATGFYGYADPTVRADPGSASQAWMLYSWLRFATGPGDEGGTVNARVVETHLASSTDLGGSWTYQSPVIWPVLPATYQGLAGYLSSETAGFSASTSGGSTLWYAIHERYFTPSLDGYNPTAQTITVRIAQAASLSDLASQTPSDELVLGGPGLDPSFGPAVNLSEVAGATTDPLVASCPYWHDTDIFYDQGKLYVGVECAVTEASQTVLAIFVTTPTGPMSTWTWSLAGEAGNPTIAQEISTQLQLSPAATSLTQVNMTRGRNGKLLLVMSPTSISATGKSFSDSQVHMGNVAVQLDSLDPLTFSRDCAGHLVIPARTSATDEVVGTGSSTYAAELTTGIILDRQPTTTTGFEMHATGLKP